METVLLQLNHAKAYQLIKDLENLNVIKILQKNGKTYAGKTSSKASDFAGSISKETAKAMLADINKNRNTWERGI